MTQGTCLCGSVRYAVDAPFEMMLHCHCSMCRKHHGAMFATFVSAPLAAFRWLAGEDAIAQHRSSEQGVRSFCKHCGSVAPQLMPDPGIVILPAGNLEGDPGIRPQGHIFVGSKAPWYAITDSLPQHDAYPPELGGGSGVPRATVQPRAGVVEGSCLCGDVAYEMTGAPLRVMNCHCSRCRRGRGAAHATNLFVSLDRFRWTRGEALVNTYRAPEARAFSVAFCTRCGAGAPSVARERAWAVIPAGGLDSDPGMRPEAHIFVGSKASWFEITDDIPQLAALPPS